MAEYFFKNKLSLEEVDEVKKFYLSLDQVTIEQHPEWHLVSGNSDGISFFFAKNKGRITAFAVIFEKRYPLLKVARISFGPLFSDVEELIEAINAIREFYTKAGFSYLFIQLGIPVDSESEYISYQLSKKFHIDYSFERANWSSLIIDLSESLDVIHRNFSKGHKSAIKKSVAEGVTVRQINASDDIQKFASVYTKMNTARGLLNTDAKATAEMFQSMYNFLESAGLGFFLAVFDNTSALVGGVIVIYQGKTARYYKGASDPDRKDVAVLHMAIYEAIKIVQQKGFKFFDLWGYNHLVDESDQVFFINRFKKGFSDKFIFYPKPMHISLKTGGYFIYRRLKENEQRLRSIFSLVKRKSNR